jgi:hypothetical protein
VLVISIALKFVPTKSLTVCPQGMQFFLAQVEQGKDNVCDCLRKSAVKRGSLAESLEFSKKLPKSFYLSKSLSGAKIRKPNKSI